MVYLLKMVIFHGYVSHNQMVTAGNLICEMTSLTVIEMLQMIATSWRGGQGGDQNKSQAPNVAARNSLVMAMENTKSIQILEAWNKGNLLVMQHWMKHNHYHLVMTNIAMENHHAINR